MKPSTDNVFRTLSDATRRNLFEYLSQHGEQTVRVLTDHSGISQPAVSKHLRMLKEAGLVQARHCGRETHYRANPKGLAPLFGWMNFYSHFWDKKFEQLEDLLERMDDMTLSATDERAVIIEKELAYPPEKLWRALTETSLMSQWLMDNDFQPLQNHTFNFRAAWGSVDCNVLAIEPHKMLSYTWDALDVKTVVTWTLTPTDKGTLLRLEQAGFTEKQSQAYHGAMVGWERFLQSLESVVSKLD